MAMTLEYIVNRYAEDKKHRSDWIIRIEKRDKNLGNLQNSIQRFITGSITLDILCNELEYYSNSKSWDSSNRKNSREWALAEMRILSKYHGHSAETYLRDTLHELDHKNVGKRIENFYRFLLQEKDRLSLVWQYVPDLDASVGKKTKGRPMAPLNGALVITFLGSIIDNKVYFCDVYVRQALTLLRDKSIIRFSGRISKDQNSKNIAIYNEGDYLQIKDLLDRLIAAKPQLGINYAWAEIFTRWIIDNQHLFG